MTTISDILADELEFEFHAACEAFARARAAQRVKDTPAARQHVAESLASVNAVLDARNARHDALGRL